MSEPALKLQLVDAEEPEIKEIKDRIFSTHTEELIIGLCGPIGTDIHYVSECLKDILFDTYGYECVILKLSDFIRRHSVSFKPVNGESAYTTRRKLIDSGNQLRKDNGSSILAELAINEIAVSRENNKKGEEFESNRICYIIDSIKNPEELELFNLVYRDIFYFIGVFSSVDLRVRNLEQSNLKTHEVYELIDRDSGEEMNFGQKVTDTFIEADFFLRVDANLKTVIEPKLRKYLNLIFSSDVVTPTANETAMYLASAAAGNSACLSRQVGASITDEKGEIISVGWNDVPKAGGGVYQPVKNDTVQLDDRRCMNLNGGMCFNDKEKAVISEALANEFIKNGLISEDKRTEVLKLVRKSRIKELIEFSRAVHAEMLAIIIGSQKAGSKLIGGKLFCTTYPCHNCARHIIASGIKEVYYIEPYRKSLAIKLHEDAITEDEAKSDLVRILMFDGVSPKRYLEFYKMNSPRKSDGRKIKRAFKDSVPKNTLSLQAIPLLEKKVTEDLIARKLIKI
jgi:deoxycytidylate deaminase